MRIGKLFALSMLTVTVFAVILGAEVLIPQARHLHEPLRRDQDGGGFRRDANG
ncbi:hypothetical protein ABIA03_003301 [Bradyrhizobium yuanmingense]